MSAAVDRPAGSRPAPTVAPGGGRPAGALPAPAPAEAAPAGSPGTGSATDAATGSGSEFLSSALQVISAVGPPVTLLTALLWYFGWARSAAEARALGFDQGVLGMSAQDYVLRGVDSLFLPLVVIAAAATVGLVLHLRILRGLERSPGRTDRLCRLVQAACAGGCVLAPVVALLHLWRAGENLVLPLVVAVAVPGVGYAGSLRARLRRQAGGPVEARSAGQRAGLALAAGGLVTLMLFWWSSAFAQVVGRGLAAHVAGRLTEQPSVIVYARQRLDLDASGVYETAYTGPGLRYPFRYDGLRFLQESNGRYFLLPERFSLAHPRVIVLANEDIRIDFGS